MSEENVERAREAYDALGLAVRKGDLDAFFRQYVHPEIEWVPLEGAPDVAPAHGHGPVKARMMAMLDVMEEPQIDPEEIIDAGERVVIAIRISGRGRASGIDVEASWFHVLTARDNKVVRIEWHRSRDEALEAAGLRESGHER
ncbi:MAG: nuclear transport factor 2 family protein [Actinomycetota bacterium]